MFLRLIHWFASVALAGNARFRFPLCHPAKMAFGYWFWSKDLATALCAHALCAA